MAIANHKRFTYVGGFNFGFFAFSLGTLSSRTLAATGHINSVISSAAKSIIRFRAECIGIVNAMVIKCAGEKRGMVDGRHFDSCPCFDR